MRKSGGNAGIWWPLTLGVLSTSFVLLVLWLSVSVHWELAIGKASMSPVFADLRVITSQVDCIIADPGWAVGSTECDPFGRAYNYPSQLPRMMAFLGIGYASTGIIGMGLACLFALSWALVVKMTAVSPFRVAHLSIAVTCLISPPVLLLIERGNSDALIFSLLTLIGFLISKERFLVSGVLIGLATALKLYPFGAIFGLLMSRSKRRITLAVTFILFALFLVLINYREWILVASSTPRPGLEGAFGSSLLLEPLFREILVNYELVARIVGPIVLILATSLVVFVSIRHPKNCLSLLISSTVYALNRDLRSRGFFAIGMGAILCGYGIAANYDYRMSLLILPILALSGTFQEARDPGFVLALLMVGMLYLTYPIPYGFQVLGDVIGFVLFPMMGAILWHLSAPNLLPRQGARINDGDCASGEGEVLSCGAPSAAGYSRK